MIPSRMMGQQGCWRLWKWPVFDFSKVAGFTNCTQENIIMEDDLKE
jgi:hypothetical protein|tara:strand:- start:2857 stop:2994 length:138 start_codon:yes stop_codon:yes gene_type:complete